MAEKFFSALVQESVSKGISFWLGKRVEKASQGHMMERLEMAVNDLEFALERSAKLPITDISLLKRRKMIKCAYAQAMELLGKHKLQWALPLGQGAKRRRWNTVCSALNRDDVQRFEWFAECAGKLVRDVEYGCLLRQHTFCNPSMRHLLEGKTLRYQQKQGNLLRRFYIWPVCSEDHGMEAVLGYRYEDSTTPEKCFFLLLVLRLSESIDIARVATKGLQFLTSPQFKLAAESAMGELTLLPTSLENTTDSFVPPCVGIQEWHTKHAQHCRPDPACCKASRHRLSGNNNNNIDISPELPHIFLQQVIFLGFQCYVSALEPSSHSSSDEEGRSLSTSDWAPPLVVTTVAFEPHSVHETMQDTKECRDASSTRSLAKTIKSDAITCMLCLPEKPRIETRRYNNIRGSTKQSTRR